jgi:DNA-binding NarL/FixJ family response regulator
MQEHRVPHRSAAPDPGMTGTSGSTVRLLIVDDHVVIRQGLVQLFDTIPDVEVIGTAEDGEQAVEQALALAPDVVLMDIGMPKLDGIAATRHLMALHPGLKIVILTAYGSGHRVQLALDAGALGYVPKHSPPEAVVRAVHAAHAGGPLT